MTSMPDLIAFPKFLWPHLEVEELAAEVEARLELVLDYISGWPRPTRKIRRQKFERKVTRSS